MQERGILNFLIRNAAGQQGVITPVGIAKMVSPPAVPGRLKSKRGTQQKLCDVQISST